MMILIVSVLFGLVLPSLGITPPRTPAPNPGCMCGWDSVSRIVGGSIVPNKHYPWQIKLLGLDFANNIKYCSGTLISPQYILTAASCVYYNQKAVYAQLGFDPVTCTFESTVMISSVIINQNWNPSSPHVNNIALLKLANPATLSWALQPACLPFRYWNTNFDNMTATATGWGFTQSGNPSSRTQYLMETTMNVFPTANCQSYYPTVYMNDNICTKKAGTNICDEDEGGPLGYNRPNGAGDATYVIGVATFTGGCSVAPSGYTKVTSYLNWIQDNAVGASFCNA